MSERPRKKKDLSGKKRKYNDRSQQPRSNSKRLPRILNNPKRGAPGFLMTCEQGREIKCQREALDIIHHYYSKNGIGASGSSLTDKDNTDSHPDAKTLSLEEEIQQLQNQQQDLPSDFGIFQTGCRGVVFALCTAPNSAMIPPIRPLKASSLDNKNNKEPTPSTKENHEKEPSDNLDESKDDSNKKSKKDTDSAEPSNDSKQVEQEPNGLTSPSSTGNPEWDPVPVVRQILEDAKKDAKDAPSSRFVTRIIPIQATCYTSPEEIEIASRMLFQQYFPKTASSFGIALKRRLSAGQLTKEKIIDIVAKEVGKVAPNIKVNLTKPDVTVVVEICKTMCGLSVIANCQEDFQHFNLAEAREANKEKDDDDGDADE